MNNIELIAISKDDIKFARKFKNVSLELCDCITYDGLSFSLKEIKSFLSELRNPTRIMVRFTPDFLIHNNLFLLEDYIIHIKNLNNPYIEGFVFGFLDYDNQLDYLTNDYLIKSAYPLKVTFHKCSDTLIENQNLALLKRLYNENDNFDQLLTQGGLRPVEQNIETLKKLSKDFNIIVGGGVNETNINLLTSLNFKIHLGRYAHLNNDYFEDYNSNLIQKLTK